MYLWKRYACYGECNVVSNECDEPTPCFVQHNGAHSGEVMYLGSFCIRGQLGFLECDDICKYVVNKQIELIEFVYDSVNVDLQHDEISLTFTTAPVCLCGIWSHVLVHGLFVRLSWYPMWMWWLRCDACMLFVVLFEY